MTPAEWKSEEKPRPKVCVLRQEGSNGDREMLSAFHEAGLEAWDVNMNDLLQGIVSSVVDLLSSLLLLWWWWLFWTHELLL